MKFFRLYGFYIFALIYSFTFMSDLRAVKFSDQAVLTEETLDDIIQDLEERVEEKKKLKRLTKGKLDTEKYIVNEYVPFFSPEDQSSKIADGRRDLEKILQEQALSRKLNKMLFRYNSLDKTDARNIIFDSCQFCAITDDSTFENVTFINCCFKKQFFKNCKFKNCRFKNSDFTKSKFISCRIYNSIFQDCVLNEWFAFDTQIELSEVICCQMQAAQIVFAIFKDCLFKQSNLTHTVIAEGHDNLRIEECKMRDPRNPIILMGGRLPCLEAFGKNIKKTLRAKGADIIFYDKDPSVFLPSLHDTGWIEEIKKGLDQLALGAGSNRVEMILSLKSVPQLQTMLKTAKRLVQLAHGIVIPGGAHIPDIFYNQDKPLTYLEASDDLLYTLFEFAIMQETKGQKKPLFGICRGLQMINVFCGGTLKDTQYGSGFERFCVAYKETTPFMYQIFELWMQKLSSYGYSNHMQTVDRLGEGLHIVLAFQDAVKAIVSHELPWIGTQFHPENGFDGRMQISHFLMKQGISSTNIYHKCLELIQSMEEAEQVKALAELKNYFVMMRYDCQQNLNLFDRFLKLLNSRNYVKCVYTENDSRIGDSLC